MRKVARKTVGGIVEPDSEWPSALQSSVCSGDGYLFFERGPVPRQIVLPSSPSANAQTVELYRDFYSSESGRVMIGVADYIPSRNSIQNITGVCGSPPVILNMEFESSSSGNQAAMISAMQSHLDIGGVVGLHDHPNNFVTGGNHADRTGYPLVEIKAGGSKRAEFLAYLDDIAAVISGLAPNPVIYRPFHEMNGEWFWWGGVDRQADLKIVWQETVDYLRITKGLTNVLFSWNLNGASSTSDATSNSINAYSGWWPGASYVDLVSFDYYDNSATPVLLRNSNVLASWNALVAIAAANDRPIYIAETGSSTGAHAVPGFWESGLFNMLGAYRGVTAVCLWTSTWMPVPNTPAAESFSVGVKKYGTLVH